MIRLLSALLGCLALASPALFAQDLDYRLAPRRIAEDTYVLIGRTEDFSRANGGNIVNTAFVVTQLGVVVIDSGPSRLYGQQLRRAIAGVTDKPVIRLINTHHHPDHYLGNQAFADLPVAALPATIVGQKQEGGGFAENLYRMSGDWMKGTESIPARELLVPGAMAVGDHEFEFIALAGHTAGDLLILDRRTGVLFAGDLVFFNRAPTTPHADIAGWLGALARIEAIPFRVMLPGHGEPVTDLRGVAQTRRYLQWLDTTLAQAAERGEEMTELLMRPLPAELESIPLTRQEFARSVAHLYRQYESRTLRR